MVDLISSVQFQFSFAANQGERVVVVLQNSQTMMQHFCTSHGNTVLDIMPSWLSHKQPGSMSNLSLNLLANSVTDTPEYMK